MGELAKRAWLLSIEYGVSPDLAPTYGWFYVGFANEEAAKNALRAHLGTRVGKRVIKGERLLVPDEIAKNRWETVKWSSSAAPNLEHSRMTQAP
ncbi:hypothetical protein IVB33_25460 [Bradyrhizobium sp. 24]|jgi:hypothetical protein|nr:hypothetical protein [Bradyrhizobium sp. 24]